MRANAVCMFALAMVVAPLGAAWSQEGPKDEAQQRRAKLRIAVQKICPVSGKPLTAASVAFTHTDPETKEQLYVCCKGCVKGTPKDEHLAVIAESLAAAQKHCLVMKDNEITPESKTAIINGQRIYICCPPCTRKMANSPEPYLKELDRLHGIAVK